MKETDRDWELLARDKPYWAVLTQDEFKTAELDTERRAAFFASGEDVVAFLLRALGRHFGAPERGFKAALDFGCGVGRLAAALAGRAERVIGVDVAPTMLEIAGENLVGLGHQNAVWVAGDDELSGLEAWRGKVDLLTSMLVFQHIAPARGERLLARLLEVLAAGGFGYVHVPLAPVMGETPFAPPLPFWRRLLRAKMPLRRAGEMQMFRYDLAKVLEIFHAAGIDELFCRMYQGGTELSLEIAFRKPGL